MLDDHEVLLESDSVLFDPLCFGNGASFFNRNIETDAVADDSFSTEDVPFDRKVVIPRISDIMFAVLTDSVPLEEGGG